MNFLSMHEFNSSLVLARNFNSTGDKCSPLEYRVNRKSNAKESLLESKNAGCPLTPPDCLLVLEEIFLHERQKAEIIPTRWWYFIRVDRSLLRSLGLKFFFSRFIPLYPSCYSWLWNIVIPLGLLLVTASHCFSWWLLLLYPKSTQVWLYLLVTVYAHTLKHIACSRLSNTCEAGIDSACSTSMTSFQQILSTSRSLLRQD